MSLLRAQTVSFAYGGTPVLFDVTLGVGRGDMLALAGPNGSGKSTLLALLAGVRRPASGRVLLDGEDIHRLARREVARRIAVVPQESRVEFPYTVAEIVLMGRAPHRPPLGLEGPHDLAVAERAMAATGVLDLAPRIITELSGGERQRVIVARALAQEPEILLLDEPTTHLDLRHAMEILALVEDLNRREGVTVVAVLHDLTSAAMHFRRVAFLRDGRVAAEGRPAEVIDEATVRAIYDADVRVVADDDGVLLVRPGRRRAL